MAELTKISEQAIAVREKSTDPDLALIKRTVAVGATNDELQMFLYDCKRRGVHPLDKLLHFTKRSGKYTPIVSIDLMRSRAAESGEMAGSDDATFEINNDVIPPKLGSATVTVYRITNGQRYPYTATARMSEYYITSPTWNKMPHVMLAKCAEALALRKAFPAQLAGLYTREEMDQAGDDSEANLKTVTSGKVDYPKPPSAQPVRTEEPPASDAAQAPGAGEDFTEGDPHTDYVPDPEAHIEATGNLKAEEGWNALKIWWEDTLTADQRDRWRDVLQKRWQPKAREATASGATRKSR